MEMYELTSKKAMRGVEKVGEYSKLMIERDENLSEIYNLIKADESLLKHSENVAQISTYMGIIYNFNLNDLIEMHTGALFHDAGKIRLKKKILYKKGIFTDEERKYTETHTSIGYKLLKDTSISSLALDIVKSHHEKLDGSGYPNLIDIRDIPIYTQIVTAADMFEAMTADRCYRKALDKDVVFEILEKDKGLNQVCVDILKRSVSIKENIEMFGIENIVSIYSTIHPEKAHVMA